MTDPRLNWYQVFDDENTLIMAADWMDGVLLSYNMNLAQLQFVSGYRVRKQEGDMDSAGLERRE